MLYLWLCPHSLLGLEFPRLLACPSPSFMLLVCLFQWVLFSTRVPNLCDGVTPAGSRIVCPRSERRFRVTIWIRCTGQFPGWTSRLCAPCPSGYVARWSSLCPCASVVLSSLQSSSLSQVRVTCCLHDHCYGSGVVIGTLPLSCQLGLVPRSVAPLCALQPLAPSFRVVLAEAAGLRRFLDLSIVVHHSQSSCQTPGVSRDGAHISGFILAPEALVSGSPLDVAGTSSGSAGASRPPAPASISSALPGPPQASTSCVETLRRFTRAAGFSSTVASQASLARRPSSRKVYQLKWAVYRSWCHSCGHSVSRPTLSKVADFLYWLRSAKGLSVSSIKGYRSMLSAVFRFYLPSLSSDPVLRDLFRSFCISSAERQLRPPAWDLSWVLRFLNSSEFEPLSRAPLCAMPQKVLFLLALATAKRVGELQVRSSVVTFVGGDACLSYVPQFVAKSESLTHSIPRFFLVKSLSDFAAGLDDYLLLCPVRTLRVYLDRTRPPAPVRHRLLVSPRRPSRALSMNAVSFFLRDVITASRAARPEAGSVRAHDIRGVSTSVAFHRN